MLSVSYAESFRVLMGVIEGAGEWVRARHLDRRPWWGVGDDMKARVKTKIYLGCESREEATGKGKV